jgi:hypothetical protein
MSRLSPSRRVPSRPTLCRAVGVGMVCAWVLGAGGAGGCYSNVVSAKGYGADRMQVTPANVPSDSAKISGYKRIEHRRLPE